MKGLTGVLEAAMQRTVEPVGNYLVSRNSAVASDLARLLEAAADLPIDVLNACEEALPFWLIVSKSRMAQERQDAFELGHDVARVTGGVPLRTPIRTRHLSSV